VEAINGAHRRCNEQMFYYALTGEKILNKGVKEEKDTNVFIEV
jgi:hypothetical protein